MLFDRSKWRPFAALAAGVATLVAVACGSSDPEIIRETVLVPQTVVVPGAERTVVVPGAESTVIVRETVIVPGAERTVVVEATPTATPATFFGLPIPTTGPGTGSAPNPKSGDGSVVIRTGLELRGSGVPGDSNGGAFLGQSVTEKFFLTDAGGDSVNQVITDWTLANDLSSLTFSLKPNVPFHGGFGNLSADDVVWSYNLGNPGFTPTSATDGGGNWSAFLGANPVVKIDDLTVRFDLATFDVRWDTFLFGQSGLGLSILSKKAFDDNGEDWARDNVIGTGPFEVKNFSRDNILELDAVQNHHRKTPAFDTLTYRAIPDIAVAEAALKVGDIDVLAGPTINLRNVGQQIKDGFVTLSAGAGSFHTISFTGNYWETTDYDTGEPLPSNFGGNTYRDAPWIGNPNDPEQMENAKKIRLALSHAIDRELIAEVLTGGAGWPGYVYGADFNNPNWQDKWEVPYDFELAGQLLDEAGFEKGSNGIRFEMPFFIRLGRGDEEIGTAVVGMWEELGIDMQEWKAQYQTYRPGLIGRSNTAPWIHSAGAEAPQQPWDWPVYTSECSRSRGAFNIGIEAPEFCKFSDDMNAEPDKAKRVLLRNEITDWLHEWNPAIATIAVPQIAIANPNKIASWDMPLSVREASIHHPEFIVLK
jgi:ABC-type transport system substrate-binding protein